MIRQNSGQDPEELRLARSLKTNRIVEKNDLSIWLRILVRNMIHLRLVVIWKSTFTERIQLEILSMGLQRFEFQKCHGLFRTLS